MNLNIYMTPRSTLKHNTPPFTSPTLTVGTDNQLTPSTNDHNYLVTARAMAKDNSAL